MCGVDRYSWKFQLWHLCDDPAFQVFPGGVTGKNRSVNHVVHGIETVTVPHSYGLATSFKSQFIAIYHWSRASAAPYNLLCSSLAHRWTFGKGTSEESMLLQARKTGKIMAQELIGWSRRGQRLFAESNCSTCSTWVLTAKGSSLPVLGFALSTA